MVRVRVRSVAVARARGRVELWYHRENSVYTLYTTIVRIARVIINTLVCS